MTDTAKDNLSRIERHAPWLVLSVSLAITLLLWQNAYRASIQEQKIEFDFQVSGIGDRIHRRITYYTQVLHSVRAFYLNQHYMERQEFTGYVASLEITRNFPGIQGISYAPLINDDYKAAHIDSVRRAGLPSYDIKPEGQHPSYAPVAYIEPLDERNSRALGFDNLSSPARKATLELARDTDGMAISEKLVLKQEEGQTTHPGFLMFLPVYLQDHAHDTVAARRANIKGWFAASFRMDDLMECVLDETSRKLRIDIFDGAISETNRMYGPPENADGQPSPRYSVTVPVDFGGRKWTMRFASLPQFEAERHRSSERNVAVAGVLSSLLLSLITWRLMRARKRELAMTSTVSRELEKRKRAEQETLKLHLLNEAILDKSPVGIAVYKASGQCVMANEACAKAVGGTVDGLLQQDFRTSAAWKRNGLLDCADQAFTTGKTIRSDIEGLTSFGKQVMLECSFAPINISGSPHLLLIVNDVSARIEAERALTGSMHQLEEKELAKSRFLAAAGHDLRQPVAAANLFVDALRLTDPTPRQSEIIQRLDRSLSTCNGLLDSLLNVSKLDAGMIKPEPASINVAELFQWLEQNFAPMAAEKKLAFRLYFPMQKALAVRSDIGLLKSVLMNLVSNAIKFTAKGAILVSARRRGAEVLFQVWDSGKGIRGADMEHIFDEFFQVDNPQRDRSGGLGLGLAIAKRALTLLGGKISCRSLVGRGSVFEFRLPLDHTTRSSAEMLAISRPEGTPDLMFGTGKRFVLVEDDALVAQGMIDWLEAAGGEVSCFHSAEDALSHFSAIENADCYIADYMLGGALTGIQFLELVRQKRGKPVKAVLVTGDTSTAFIRHAAECDWPVLHKPVTASRLLSALNMMVTEGGRAG